MSRFWFLDWRSENCSEKELPPSLARQSAEKLSDGDNSNPVPSGHLDQIKVALEIVVSGNQIHRVATDSGFEDFIVIGIAAGFQFTGSFNQRRPRGHQSDKPFSIPRRISESSQEARAVKNLRELCELRN